MKRIYILIYFISIHAILFSQSDTSLVLLSSIDSTIVQEVKYATKDNFTGKILYPTPKVYLRKIVARKLAEANSYLKEKHNLRLKIFDGYRPLSVQKLMWEVYPDPNYVARPSRGSKHNRGAAVDITLVDIRGNELEMGTEYDNFSTKAHFNSKSISPEARKNRDLMRSIMNKFGFKGISTEWWHFDFKGWKNYSILDLPVR